MAPEIITAAVGSIATVVVAWLAFRSKLAELSARQNEMSRRVGVPNGQGNVVDMLERLLAGQTGQDVRLAKHDRDIAALRAGQDKNSQALDEIRSHVCPQREFNDEQERRSA